MQNDSLLQWVLAGIATLLGGAATVIASLWKTHESSNAKRIASLETELAECEKKHGESKQEILALSVKIAAIESRQQVMEEIKVDKKS